jgi:hypothetical protein
MVVLSDGELTPVRQGKRNANTADVNSLEKAGRRVAAKNLEEPQGNLCVNSFCSLSNFHIQENLVGINMGDNDNLVANSFDLLRNMEYDRIKPIYCPSKIEEKVESRGG